VYLKPISFNREIGVRVIILDFVCLDSSKRGGGLGRWLIAKSLGALAEEYEFCELRTSQNNYPAQDCYADLGFRVVSTDFVLHGDFEPDPNAAPI
jgi:ribosomal protein S18 acetylase RimI-like enzyme